MTFRRHAISAASESTQRVNNKKKEKHPVIATFRKLAGPELLNSFTFGLCVIADLQYAKETCAC